MVFTFDGMILQSGATLFPVFAMIGKSAALVLLDDGRPHIPQKSNKMRFIERRINSTFSDIPSETFIHNVEKESGIRLF